MSGSCKEEKLYILDTFHFDFLKCYLWTEQWEEEYGILLVWQWSHCLLQVFCASGFLVFYSALPRWTNNSNMCYFLKTVCLYNQSFLHSQYMIFHCSCFTNLFFSFVDSEVKSKWETVQCNLLVLQLEKDEGICPLASRRHMEMRSYTQTRAAHSLLSPAAPSTFLLLINRNNPTIPSGIKNVVKFKLTCLVINYILRVWR